jgi:LytR_cpsA_psr family
VSVTGGQDVKSPGGTPPGSTADLQPSYADVDEEARGDLEHWRRFASKREQVARRVRGRHLDRRSMAAGAGAVALILFMLAIWRPWSGGSDVSPGDKALGGPRASVLVQIRSAAGRAIANAVVMHDRERDRGSVVGIPDDLAVDVPDLGVETPASDRGSVRLVDALNVAGESLTRDAVADVLGADLAGSFVLDTPTFASLVTRIGGIEVKVGAPVSVAGTVVARPSTEPARLNGAAAVSYISIADGTSATRAGRFVQVLEAVVAKIPPRYDLAAELIDAVGLIGNGTLTPERLAAILSGAAGDRTAGTLRAEVLPVQADGLLDVSKAAPMVRDMLGGALTGRSDGTPRVLVQLATAQTGSARDALRERARAAVLNAGYRFVDGGVVSPRASSTIMVYGGEGIGDALAFALGLDTSAVRAGKGDGAADAVVVLGRDYQP